MVLIVLLAGVPYVGSAFRRTVAAQQYTFAEVASGLQHRDVAVRLRAIQILIDADYAEAAVPIAAALEDPDDRVQLAAIDAERTLFTTRPVARRKKIGFVVEVRTIAGGDAAATGQLALKPRTVPPQVLASLAVALRDNNSRVRAEAVNLASLLGPYACATVRLKSDPADVARPGVDGPGRVRLPAFAEAAAGHAKARENQASGGGQADRGCEEIGNALVENINSREPLLRRAAMQVLGQVRYPNAVQALSDRFSYHQRGPDAMAALEGLAGIGHPTSVSVFEQLLTNSNAGMRRYAVEGLARIGNRDALPALQQMGQSERSNGVLLALHYANVKLGEVASSLEQLVAALDNESQRPVVLNYLLDIAVQSGPAVAESLKHERADVRRLIADVLGFSHDPNVIPMLEAATKDADPDVAAAAGQAIVRLKL